MLSIRRVATIQRNEVRFLCLKMVRHAVRVKNLPVVSVPASKTGSLNYQIWSDQAAGLVSILTGRPLSD
jgi:hypothetical protein